MPLVHVRTSGNLHTRLLDVYHHIPKFCDLIGILYDAHEVSFVNSRKAYM